ncbi:hypothetical protein F2Q70_00010959 [Brassica cretica]|uniref:Uncharacterized protein n=1 Tax=Brassica cretica TaxID=69181 RepID=A0A8S9J6J1_BRACR|nr:hypothetical protein F2Q68_00004069 [Brassica cretica]KAF2612716.1 hypothetical protein F2Q70_00010959 [Brassica cretica]
MYSRKKRRSKKAPFPYSKQHLVAGPKQVKKPPLPPQQHNLRSILELLGAAAQLAVAESLRGSAARCRAGKILGVDRGKEKKGHCFTATSSLLLLP